MPNHTNPVADEGDERAVLTADILAFTRESGELETLLIRRGWDPDAGKLALPGGKVNVGERTVDAAAREFAEETGLALAEDDLIKIDTFDAPGRDPRGRYVSTLFLVVLSSRPEPLAGTDATEAGWFRVDTLIASGAALAFDHAQQFHAGLDALPYLDL